MIHQWNEAPFLTRTQNGSIDQEMGMREIGRWIIQLQLHRARLGHFGYRYWSIFHIQREEEFYVRTIWSLAGQTPSLCREISQLYILWSPVIKCSCICLHTLLDIAANFRVPFNADSSVANIWFCAEMLPDPLLNIMFPIHMAFNWGSIRNLHTPGCHVSYCIICYSMIIKYHKHISMKFFHWCGCVCEHVNMWQQGKWWCTDKNAVLGRPYS